MKGVAPTERQIQRAVLQMCGVAFPKVLIHHSPNGAHLAGGDEARFKQMGALKGDGMKIGWPDLIAVWRGGVAFLEVKRPGGKLSEAQFEMHDRLALMDHNVAVVHSPTAAFDHLKACGAPTNMREWPQ